MEKKTSVYGNVCRQFDKAADMLKLNPDIREILAKTNNEIIVNFPVKMELLSGKMT